MNCNERHALHSLTVVQDHRLDDDVNSEDTVTFGRASCSHAGDENVPARSTSLVLISRFSGCKSSVLSHVGCDCEPRHLYLVKQAELRRWDNSILQETCWAVVILMSLPSLWTKSVYGVGQ
jgi:hypothetical protein